MADNHAENTVGRILAADERYEIPMEAQKFILQLCWARHDAQWFLKSKRKFGVEHANGLNREVIFSMGKIEARHVLSALNIPKYEIKTIPDAFKLINTFMHVFVPEIMEFEMVHISDTEGVGLVRKCYVWEEVRRAKGEAEYICACNDRHRGWLEAMELKGKILPVKRIPDGDDSCEFRFILQQ
jgi:hypothetical protein